MIHAKAKTPDRLSTLRLLGTFAAPYDIFWEARGKLARFCRQNAILTVAAAPARLREDAATGREGLDAGLVLNVRSPFGGQVP
jgi:hypothetical protein